MLVLNDKVKIGGKHRSLTPELELGVLSTCPLGQVGGFCVFEQVSDLECFCVFTEFFDIENDLKNKIAVGSSKF